MVGEEVTLTFPFFSSTIGKEISFLEEISMIFGSNEYAEEDGVLERNLVFDVKGELFISLLLLFVTPLHCAASSPPVSTTEVVMNVCVVGFGGAKVEVLSLDMFEL